MVKNENPYLYMESFKENPKKTKVANLIKCGFIK